MAKQDNSNRDIAGFTVGLIVATVLTIFGTYYVLTRYVLDSDDPIYKAGGLKPNQVIK